jgi:Tfp pilus assembly protein PilF
MPDTVVLLHEIAANCEREAEKTVQLNACILALRRRIRAALDYLAQDKPDEAKQMLQAALEDNGEFIRRRIDKAMRKWLAEHPV